MCRLADEFENWNSGQLDELGEMVCGFGGGGGYFPPYIPYVGSHYWDDWPRFDDEKPRILVYATAQNMVPGDKYHTQYASWSKRELVERLCYSWDRSRKHPEQVVEFSEILINPYQAGPLPSLAGVFLHVRFGESIPELSQIHGRIAVSNWYKFSLHQNGSNLNPPGLPKQLRQPYEELNDDLVRTELKALGPNHVIVASKSRSPSVLSDAIRNAELTQVSDPACLLHGCRPKPDRMPERAVTDLVDGYLKQFRECYDPDSTHNPYCAGQMREHVKNYLLYWAEQFGKEVRSPEENNNV